MPGPLAIGAITVGSAIAGRVLRGSRREPRSFSQFLADFESRHAPERWGLPGEQYQEALTRGRREIVTQRDVGASRGLTRLREAGLGRSAAASTVGLRSASAAEQAYTGLLSRLSALDAQFAEQQKTNLRSQAISAFQAQSLEDARVGRENLEADQQLGQMIQSFVEPIESFYLLRDLRAMRALTFQPSSNDQAINTQEMFETEEALGRFDLTLEGGNF